MEKVFAKKLGFLPDKESEFLILDKVELRVGDGNEADKAVFGKILVEFKKQINFDQTE